MSQKKIKMRVKDLKAEDGSEELVKSPAMRPYLNLLATRIKGGDVAPLVATITELPLKDRYVWRIVSALKWAFADFDSMTVKIDRETLTTEDLQKVTEFLPMRCYQFVFFLRALLGDERTKQLVVSALEADSGTKGQATFTP